MVVCLLRLMYGPFVYGSAEHVIATWTVVIAVSVARTAAAVVAHAVFVVALHRNGKCYAGRVLYRSHAENKFRLDVCSPEVIQQLVIVPAWYVYVESGAHTRKNEKCFRNQCVHALAMIRGTFTLHSDCSK